MHPFSDDASRGQRPTPAEMPKAEPEIIPPGADFPRGRRADGVVFAQHGARFHVRPLGPFGIVMVLLAAGVVGAITLLVLLGAVLVGAAAAGVIVLAALLSRLLRGAR